MNTFARRLVAAALSTAVATGSALVAAPAQAAPNAYAASAAGWLSRQLTGGVVHNDQFKVDDYGLSLDVYFALKALGRPAAAASVLRRMDDDPGAYVGTGSERYAGATGKLATAVVLQGRAPRSFGGVNLVSRLEALVDTTHPGQVGRAVDRTPFGDLGNTIGQGWVVRALAGSGSRLADEATGFLVRQQCSAGFFREGFEPTTATGTSFTCNGARPAATASIDSTALAVQALVTARAHGVRGLDDELSRAASWLVRQQRPNGAFVGNGVSNSNTTGLAAAALVATGRTVAAERAAAWVSRLQVSASVAQRSPRLRREVGAIAYNGAALAAGARSGIPVDQRDQWRRASAQAAIGVNAVRIVRVGAPRGHVHGGSRVLVRLAGLAAGERFTLRATGVRTVQGNASARGLASARIRLPRVTRPIPSG